MGVQDCNAREDEVDIGATLQGSAAALPSRRNASLGGPACLPTPLRWLREGLALGHPAPPASLIHRPRASSSFCLSAPRLQAWGTDDNGDGKADWWSLIEFTCKKI